MGKAILIVLVGSILLLASIIINVNNRIMDATNSTYKNFNDEQARNISNSMMQMIYTTFYDSTDWRVNSTASNSFFNGTCTYTIKDSIFEADSVVKITVNSVFAGSTNTLISYIPKTTGGGWVPQVMRAAWIADGNLNHTISNMNIDGRDHSLTGTVISKTGARGVSTGGAFTNTFSAMIGGTKDSVDYPLSYPANSNVVEQNYNWGGTFPTSPDKILGYPEGTLKMIAKTGANGSQYVTDVKNLHFPVSGITYIEVPGGKTYSLNFGTKLNTGMVIWHNTTNNASLVGIQSSLPFRGILVGDFGFHYHLDVIGAIVLLSPNLELNATCNGNNGHSVLYSSAAIKNATAIASKYSGVAGNNTNYNGSTTPIGNSSSIRLKQTYVLEY